MAKKKYYESYAGMDNRRAMEKRDSMMISEDRSAVANLPQGVIMREYPRAPYGEAYGLNDNIRGIDEQMYKDSRGKKSDKYPEKY